jgi:hypothetical protein
MVDMSVPSNFDWETSKDFDIVILSEITQMVALSDEDGNVIQKIWIKAGQEFSTNITLPTYHSSINVIASSGVQISQLNSTQLEIQL